MRKRKEFEEVLRRQRQHIGIWLKYAQWEAAQQNFRQARSIFERALDIEFQNHSIWLKYLEMEMRNKFVNHARNLFNRVTGILPRVDQFWYKFAHMEELLGNYAGARTIYDRWMEWEPEDLAWLQYVKFEERCNELERARIVMEKYVNCRPSVDSFIRLCKFEEKNLNVPRCRAAYERGIEVLGDDDLDEKFYLRFAQFEERAKEIDRARAIFKLALDRLPKSQSQDLYKKYVAFEKQRGGREEVDNVVLNRRRFKYEEELKEGPRNYDAWFDYIRLEESTSDLARIREIYERAIASRPPLNQKRFWRRYIFFWLNYALFEELEAGDIPKTRSVYEAMIKAIPHQQFSFAKVWRLYAEFECRQLNIDKARKIFGQAIGVCGKVKIFKAYADLEMRLGNIDRCRKIYEKFIEIHPLNPISWKAFVELETVADEEDRARAICEIAIGQEQLDRPEILWKTYIDLEVSLENYDNARAIWERLLEKTTHVRVWSSFTDFEAEHGDIEKCRALLERGVKTMKDEDKKEERAQLLEKWKGLEAEKGDEENLKKVENRQPKKVQKRRAVMGEDGTEEGYEEYIDYIFPDDSATTQNLKILEMAKKWKMAKAE